MQETRFPWIIALFRQPLWTSVRWCAVYLELILYAFQRKVASAAATEHWQWHTLQMSASSFGRKCCIMFLQPISLLYLAYPTFRVACQNHSFRSCKHEMWRMHVKTVKRCHCQGCHGAVELSLSGRTAQGANISGRGKTGTFPHSLSKQAQLVKACWYNVYLRKVILDFDFFFFLNLTCTLTSHTNVKKKKNGV